jgi:hypothetical protein
MLSTAAVSHTRQEVDPDETQLNDEYDNASHTEDEDREADFDDEDLVVPESQAQDAVEVAVLPFQRNQQQQQKDDSIPVPPEWEGVSPDMVLKSLKALKADVLQPAGLREYYKSYPSWAKMKPDQRNKALSWFRSLPDNLQGLFYSLLIFYINFLFYFINVVLCFLSSVESVMQEAAAASLTATQNEANVNSQTTKDDIVRLMHLFEEPRAQRHWSNLYGVLKRAELDARKSNGEHSEAANPLDYLAEIFNDYETFCPQNAMVRYVSPGAGLPPVKKQPYQASGSEWAIDRLNRRP